MKKNKMKKLLNGNNEFQNEITLNNSILNDKSVSVNDSLTESRRSDTATDFLVPECLETAAPNKIPDKEWEGIPTESLQSKSITSLDPDLVPQQASCINPVVEAPVFHLVNVPVFQIDIHMVEPHPLVLKVYKEKNLQGLKLTMKLKGLLEPIKVVRRNGKFFIVEGISRYLAALELGWKTLSVIVVDFTDEEIQEQFVFRNYRTKRSIEELTSHAEVILGVLGLSQGKKRERIGGLELGDDNYCLVGKDRFEIACDVLGIDISPSSLRRLMQVKEFVKNGDEEVKKLNLIDRLDRGEMKINQAFHIVENYSKCKKEQGSNEMKETLEIVKGKNYQLYNKTCEDLSDLEDESIDCATESCPYFQQKDYSRGEFDSNQIGLEKTVDQFVDKQVEIHRGVYKKLKKTGSLFIVIADSYDKGVDCLVVEKLIIKMVESGWKFIQKWYWVKDNPKPQNQIKRLLPNYEYCLHFVKDVKAYHWRDFNNWKDGEFKLVKGSNERELSRKRENHSWTLQKPIERFRSFLSEQHVDRVLQTNGFRWKELEEIDPEYRHQAPFPSVITLLPILLTTRIGYTVLDIYNGTSTTTAVALQLGRKAIGYDIDKVNHEFAAKRLQKVEQSLPNEEEILALEAEFTCEREFNEFNSDSKKAA